MASIAAYRTRMVNSRSEVSGEKKLDLSEGIDR
jgi:hypothetical protein